MDNVCYQCGAGVEAGRPFCGQCNAPQISVRIAEPATEPAAESESVFPSPELSSPDHAGAIDWSHALAAAAFAVLLAAAFIVIPIGTPVGLAVLASGFLAVLFYRRKTSALNLTLGLGARLGALTGMVGYVASMVFLAVETSAFHVGGEVHKKLLVVLAEHAPAPGSDPQLQQVMEFYKTSQGFTVMMLIGLVMALAAFLLLGSLGGVIGAALLRRKANL